MTTKDMPMHAWLSDESWDQLRLDGRLVPGVARIRAKQGRCVDVKKPKGASRAIITDEGVPPVELDIEIELMADELDAFKPFLKLARPAQAKKDRVPVSIAHPTCAVWNVHQVMIASIRSNHPATGGTLIFSIDAIEHRPPEKLQKSSKGPEPNPQTTAEIERRLLQERIANLRGETFNPARPNETVDDAWERLKPSRPENVQANFSGRPSFLFPDPRTPKLP